MAYSFDRVLLRSELFEVLGRGAVSTVHADRDGRVVKVFTFGTPMQRVELELSRLAAVVAAGVDTPANIEGCVRISDGRLAFRLAPGKSTVTAQAHLVRAPWHVRPLMRAAARCLLDIHHAETPRQLPDMSETVVDHIVRSSSISLTRRREVISRLKATAGGNRPKVLCHGNFALKNTLWHRQGCQAISWFNAAIAPPEADLARAYVMLRFCKGGLFLRRIGAALARLLVEEYLDACEDPAAISDALPAWVVAHAVRRSGEDVEHRQRLAMIRFVDRPSDISLPDVP